MADPTSDGPDAARGLADGLSRLARLHEAGSLTADEFAAAKARLLGGNGG